jgi:hypothetical protein
MKVIKKHIQKAVLIYEDPQTGEGRRVTFGEAGEVLDLLMSQIPLITDRLWKLSKRKFESPKEMINYYQKHKNACVKLHGIKAGEKMELNLTYEAKNLK